MRAVFEMKTIIDGVVSTVTGHWAWLSTFAVAAALVGCASPTSVNNGGNAGQGGFSAAPGAGGSTPSGAGGSTSSGAGGSTGSVGGSGSGGATASGGSSGNGGGGGSNGASTLLVPGAGNDYTFSGNTVTLNLTPAAVASDSFFVIYMKY